MKNLKYSVGIDMSMQDFSCCLSVINEEQEVTCKASHKFSNNPSGFKQLLNWTTKCCTEKLQTIFVMEATGVYHEQLTWFLHSKGLDVSVMLANKAKKYLQANGSKSKNDKIDAKGLAQIGAEKKLVLWAPPSENLYILRSFTRHHQSINELHLSMSNQLHSILHAQFQNKDVIRHMKNTLKMFKQQLKEVEQSIANLIKSDKILHQHYQNITAIKGIGMLSFAVIVAETNGFALFDKAASLVSFAGYDTVENQSGKHTGRTRISKKGNSKICRIMFMPALCAVREDQPQFAKLYERIYTRTHLKMKAYVAVQKKLLIMMYYLWKKNERYNPMLNDPENIVASNNVEATHDEPSKVALTEYQI